MVGSTSSIWVVINHTRSNEFSAAFSTLDRAMNFIYTHGDDSWDFEVRKIVLDRTPRDALRTGKPA